jgi:hypothetical protein
VKHPFQDVRRARTSDWGRLRHPLQYASGSSRTGGYADTIRDAIQIPATGGGFDFNIAVANNGVTPVSADIWCDVTLLNGSSYGPVLGPVNLTLAAGFTLARDRTQTVPEVAPSGNYLYNAYAGSYPNTVISEDHFDFEKLSTGDGAPADDWNNYGESFEPWMTAVETLAVPEVYSLDQNYPNPFNPVTTISYQLSAVSFVDLSVYDISGKKVADLVNGWSDVGSHEVIFDGSDLISGVYVYRIQAGEYDAAKKMLLVK